MQEENLYTPNCIRTFTGIYFNILHPTEDMVCIEDIAHSLSMQCRFGAHLPTFYSVAQHSLTVSYNCKDKMAGLLHDASEAYLMDIPTPAKLLIPNYYEIESRVMAVIAKKFGFDYPLPDEVKDADKTQLIREWHNVFLASNWATMTAKQAKKDFLLFYKRITTGTTH